MKSPGIALRIGFVVAAAVMLFALIAIGRLGAAVERHLIGDAVTKCSSTKPCLAVTNSGKGNGIDGTTLNPSSKDKLGTAGVQGIDGSTDGGQDNIGVQGISNTSNGVEGITNNPSSTSPFGRAAVFGIDASTDGGTRNWGTAGYSKNGTGVFGLSYAGAQTSGAPFASALLAVCGNGGPSIEAADGPSPSNNLFLFADCSGNMIIEGTVTTGKPPLVMTKSRLANDVAAYAPREAQASIEDFGRSQLSAGYAHVELARDFAATISRDASYLVMITPEGDSHGLYVAQKTPDGFDVRESQGGRSSIAFTYQIVARPADDKGVRLPRISSPLTHKTAQAAAHESQVAAVRQIGVPMSP